MPRGKEEAEMTEEEVTFFPQPLLPITNYHIFRSSSLNPSNLAGLLDLLRSLILYDTIVETERSRSNCLIKSSSTLRAFNTLAPPFLSPRIYR